MRIVAYQTSKTFGKPNVCLLSLIHVDTALVVVVPSAAPSEPMLVLNKLADDFRDT
ncbi:MAG: hypothetical protein KDB11_07055 [Planctomycetales bacterium]|nr:hypothetical protein [Planctomycetales bacterium]